MCVDVRVRSSLNRTLALPLLLALGACGAAGADGLDEDEAELRGGGPVDTTLPDVDAQGYDVDLRIDDAKGKESFSATTTGTFVATKNLDKLSLDFEGNTVDDVLVGKKKAAFEHKDGRLVITLPSAVPSGKKFSVRVRYHGAIAQADGADPNDFKAFGGLMVRQQNADKKRIFNSMNWPGKARRWIPLRDHPSDGASFAITTTMPKSFVVLANGKEVEKKDNADGTRSTRFEATTPMPAYDFHVGAYEDWHEDTLQSSPVPMAAFTYSSASAKSNAVFGDLPKAMKFFESTFGKYRWESANFLEEPIFGGGMENAGVVSMDETLFADTNEARFTAFHELSHHWSGNLVRIRSWNDFWLSEGFAQYLTAEAIGALDGPAAKQKRLRDYMAAVLHEDTNTPHALRPSGDEVDVLTIFDAISYDKGALTLRMLGSVVGPDKLNAFLKTWFDRHAFEAVTTADFQKELSVATKKDLSKFFDGFVSGTHHPVMRVTYEAKGDGADVTVEQVQTKGPAEGFVFPLALDFVDAAGKTERVAVDVTNKKTTAHVKLARTPASVVVDPDEVVMGVATCDKSTCKTGFECKADGEVVSVCEPPMP